MFGRQSLSFRRIARAFPPRGRASALRHLALGVSRIARRPWIIGVFSAADVLTVLLPAECS